MRIGKGTWVLVADGEKFLLFENRGNAERIDLRVIRHREVESPPTREQGTDQPGRFNDPGLGRSATEQTDWHRLDKERFAKELAERLRAWALDNRFEALLLAADPRTLGVLRPALHKAVAERVVGEVDKDLTRMPVDEIERVLQSG